jgi:hypothetical protein
MTGRMQSVQVGMDMTELILNPYGVPQGGGLSPILFVIFTAYMPDVCTVAQLILNTDDTTGFVVGDLIEDVCQDLEKA